MAVAFRLNGINGVSNIIPVQSVREIQSIASSFTKEEQFPGQNTMSEFDELLQKSRKELKIQKKNEERKEQCNSFYVYDKKANELYYHSRGMLNVQK